MSRGRRQWQMRIGMAYWTVPSIFLGLCPSHVGLAHLLHHILAMCHIPAPSKTILVKVLVRGQKKSLEAAC